MAEEISDLFSQKIANFLSLKNLTCHIHKGCSSEPTVLGRTVCYIVGAVIINDQNEVLLIQEAKASCRGTWYLPAGRVEPNESLVEAIKREVVEESGLVVEPTGLVCIEENGRRWFRFTFACKVVGGSLKKIEQADSESLQASWFKDLHSVHLRNRDILKAIEIGKLYYHSRKLTSNKKSTNILPTIFPHKNIFVRLLILRQVDNCDWNVLVKPNTSLSFDSAISFPVSCYESVQSISFTAKSVVNEFLQNSKPWSTEIHGALQLEHSGDSTHSFDGLCLNLLASLQSNNHENIKVLPVLKSTAAVWHPISLPMGLTIEHIKAACIPILSCH